MGIRLDWEIEAEQSHLRQRSSEDAITRRKRRMTQLRLLLIILVIPALLLGSVFVVLSRLRAADGEIEQSLRNTIDAEVTALRIGDFNAFSAAQRSASDDWMQKQQGVFNDYQNLKLSQVTQLTGQILSLTIDHNRARAEIQEIINGVPYTRVWFYWRYDDGWRHVPPDYTFWGDVETYPASQVEVRYQTVDDTLAKAMGDEVAQWIQSTCNSFACGALPHLMIDIVPDEALQVTWSAGNPWLLQVPSPYVRRARSDMPFDLDLRFAVAGLLAERLVAYASGDMRAVYPTDAYYLRQAIVSWLIGRFVQLDTNAFIVSSLATNYGDAAVGQLLANLKPDSSLDVLGQITGVASLEQAKLDWRDFLTWRLVTEDQLIQHQSVDSFLALYDTRDEVTRNLAYQRFAQPAQNIKQVVTAVQLETDMAGIPVLRAVVQVGEVENLAQKEVLFRLVDGVWKRAN